MQLTMTRRDEMILVQIQGRLDINTAPELETKLLVPAAIPGIRMVLDMGGLEYLSSYGLRVLLKLTKVLHQHDGALKLVAVPELVLQVLNTSGLARFLSIHPTVEAALADQSRPELADF